MGKNIELDISINTYKIHWYKYAYRESVFCESEAILCIFIKFHSPQLAAVIKQNYAA